jgi:hypothetical protein
MVEFDLAIAKGCECLFHRHTICRFRRGFISLFHYNVGVFVKAFRHFNCCCHNFICFATSAGAVEP